MNSASSLGDTVEAGTDAARAAVAFVRPRLRGVLHELAFPVSLLAGVWAIVRASPGAPRAATSIYAATLSACLGVSALYHRGHWSVRMRALMRRLDHATIFMLVAGTFTPIAAIAVSGGLSVATLVVVWGGALFGSVLATVRNDLPRALEVGPYIGVGAFGVVLMPHLLRHLGVAAVALLVLGGIVYIAGALIFAWQRPNPWPRTFGFHEIFHSAVLAAATLQWVAITFWVLPAT